METIKLNIYRYSELSDEAKQSAMRYFEKHYDDSCYAEQARLSAREAQKIYDKFRHIEREIKGARLYKWIVNNILPELETRKFYHIMGNRVVSYYSDGRASQYHKGRFSRIQRETGWTYGLTGVCYDCDFLGPLYDFMNKPTDNTDNDDLARTDLDYIFRQIMDREYEDFFDDEWLSEYAGMNMNTHYFDKHGNHVCNSLIPDDIKMDIYSDICEV